MDTGDQLLQKAKKKLDMEKKAVQRKTVSDLELEQVYFRLIKKEVEQL